MTVSTTPPLTPASRTSSPTVATSAGSGKDIRDISFFASSYYDGGDHSSTGASYSEKETGAVPILQHVRLAVVSSFNML